MYELLGITLVLVLLLTINATATFIAAGIARACKRLLWQCSARTRAEILFVMRIGPPVIAIVAIAAFMIPSWLTYEPYATKETVSWKLGALAAVSAIGVALAISRGLRSWLATRSLLKQWLQASTPIHLESIKIRTFVLRHSFPIIAVVGDRKSTRLNSSHGYISYAVFCLKKKITAPTSPSSFPALPPTTNQTRHSILFQLSPSRLLLFSSLTDFLSW